MLLYVQLLARKRVLARVLVIIVYLPILIGEQTYMVVLEAQSDVFQELAAPVVAI